MIKKVAKDDGYDFVLNTASLAYAREDYDMTQKVLEALLRELETQDQAGGQ